MNEASGGWARPVRQYRVSGYDAHLYPLSSIRIACEQESDAIPRAVDAIIISALNRGRALDFSIDLSKLKVAEGWKEPGP